jgi:hypothetical protein
VRDLGQILALEGLLAGQDLVEDDAEREDVGAVVDVAGLDLLGSHVVRRPQQLSLHRQVRGVEPGDAEVGDLDLVVGGDQDVRRLDVAMDHAPRVGVVEGLGDLRHQIADESRREGLGALQQLLEVGPLDVLHGDEADAVGAFVDHVVDGDDVRVREDAGALRFAHEAAAKLRQLVVLGREAGAKGLQRHQAADQRIARQVDDAHGPLADLLEDLVAAELLGFGRGHRGLEEGGCFSGTRRILGSAPPSVKPALL